MTPAVVVDLGNSRLKWGRCVTGHVTDLVSLPLDEADAWERQLHGWGLQTSLWAVSGVNPPRHGPFLAWLQAQGHSVLVVDQWQQLSLKVELEHPERVGMDRLLDAVAVNTRRQPNTPAVVIDAGTAVTVDWLDESGTFRGGAIIPGLRLMAQSLHEHTALLPTVTIRSPRPAVPGTSTTTAIEAGIYWSVVGGIEQLLHQLTAQGRVPPQVFLTGGDAPLLQPALTRGGVAWPTMTLEGIRLAAEALA